LVAAPPPQNMKNFPADGYPENWEKDPFWICKLSVHLGYPEAGWTPLSLVATFYDGSLTVNMSEVYDPFWRMIDWLKAIADNQLPASLEIDEEGSRKKLIVRRYEGRYAEFADIEFRVIGDNHNEITDEVQEGCFFFCLTTRSHFVREFCRRIESWLQHDYDPEGWHKAWREDDPENPFANLHNLDIAGLKEKIKDAGFI
jgi:hypothetical protein